MPIGIHREHVGIVDADPVYWVDTGVVARL